MGFNESLHFKEEHKFKAQWIKDEYRNEKWEKGNLIITIGGGPGTGKSEIAWWLARKLYRIGVCSHILSLDRFYKIPVCDRNKKRRITKIIGYKEMDWRRINKEICEFRNNLVKILIVEGLYSGYIKDVDLKVHLEGSMQDTYDFRKIRGKENPDSTWRKYVIRREYKSIEKIKDNANLIIPTEVLM